MFGIILSCVFVIVDLLLTQEIAYRRQLASVWSSELEESIQRRMNARANKLIQLLTDLNLEIEKSEYFMAVVTVTESWFSK